MQLRSTLIEQSATLASGVDSLEGVVQVSQVLRVSTEDETQVSDTAVVSIP